MLPMGFPADRWEWSPDPGVGVDTIAIAGPTSEDLLELLRHHQIERALDLETGELTDRRRAAYTDLRLGLSNARVRGRRVGGTCELRLELSLPKMLTGHNRDPLGRELLREAVDAALHALAEALPDVPHVDDVWVQRLDLARDFHELNSPTLTLVALSHRHVAQAQHNHQYLRPDGSMQCLERGSIREYLVRGYAKGHQLTEGARKESDPQVRRLLRLWAEVSAGQLRYELQLRARVLRRKGIRSMKDCTPDALEGLARAYYDKVGWAEPYGGDDRLRQALTELLDGLKPAQGRNLLVYVFAKQLGMQPPLTRHPLDKARALAREHNLLDPCDSSPLRRLDFDSGRELDR